MVFQVVREIGNIDARCSTFFGGFDVFRGVFEGLQIVEMKESVSICNDDDDI